jgi:serine/threonine-protein kinase
MKSFLLSRINPLYDRAWDDFFIKTLEWNPSGRFAEAEEMKNALLHLELHWEKKKKEACLIIQAEENGPANSRQLLRVSPVRVSGADARRVFNVNELWQPVHYTPTSFIHQGNKTVMDKATGIIWQRNDFGYPVNRQEADEVISAMNTRRFGGLSCWRLPTVNELLSLVSGSTLTADDCHPDTPDTSRNWYWSCDRRSEQTSWYVNIRPGYTGWQENGCRYSILAVASLNGDAP